MHQEGSNTKETTLRISLLLEVVLLFVDKLDSTLQKESLGWGSPTPDHHT